MRQLIAGNWKMNLAREPAIKLATELADASAALACDLVICTPFPMIYPLALALDGTNIPLGGQDCSEHPDGAFTGDVSAAMLVDAGASYVILGHSERREYHAETSAQVRAKTQAATRAGLTPIICVGETEAERQGGQEQTAVGTRLEESLPDNFAGVVSYEPIWAIGTGRTPTPQDVAGMHEFIRAKLVARFGASGQELRILYGGSVKPGNAAVLLAIPNVNGALVGGASLVADQFLAIARAVKE